MECAILNANTRPHAFIQTLHFGFVNIHLDLHLGQIWELDDRLALANGRHGMTVGREGNPGAVVARNVAIGNRLSGIVAQGAGTVVTGNAASANGGGISIDFADGARVTRNVVHANGLPSRPGSGVGISVRNSDAVKIERNSVVGNRSAGVSLVANGIATNVTKNNLFGNGSIFGNCATNNGTAPMTASGNYWGSATGPGADPADLACDFAAGSTDVDPFAKKELRVRTKKLLLR